MTLDLARQSYSRAAQAGVVAPEDPHAIIGLTLTELQSSMEALRVAAQNGAAMPSGPMTRALAALYLLQNSLDFERGGEIAPALFRVYEYCRVQVVGAFTREAEDPQGLEKAISFIASLRSAWSEIKERTAAE
ncbi:flagellar export chaperone FliS [Paracoccus sp. T5]|uniref:flagellar export chaperone FliS n=1 Tax=Paracoccus sp. T5 TaxID=3402161 RepID=UPI003AE76580